MQSGSGTNGQLADHDERDRLQQSLQNTLDHFTQENLSERERERENDLAVYTRVDFGIFQTLYFPETLNRSRHLLNSSFLKWTNPKGRFQQLTKQPYHPTRLPHSKTQVPYPSTPTRIHIPKPIKP